MNVVAAITHLYTCLVGLEQMAHSQCLEGGTLLAVLDMLSINVKS